MFFLNLIFQKYILIHLFQPLETFLAVITFPPTLTSGNVSSASVGNLAKALVSTKSYDSLLID